MSTTNVSNILPDPSLSWRENRFTDARFVRCPANCPRDIGCPQCSFWGTVPKGSDDAICVHRNVRVGSIGRCLTSYQCSLCGLITAVDSSD